MIKRYLVILGLLLSTFPVLLADDGNNPAILLPMIWIPIIWYIILLQEDDKKKKSEKKKK